MSVRTGPRDIRGSFSLAGPEVRVWGEGQYLGRAVCGWLEWAPSGSDPLAAPSQTWGKVPCNTHIAASLDPELWAQAYHTPTPIACDFQGPPAPWLGSDTALCSSWEAWGGLWPWFLLILHGLLCVNVKPFNNRLACPVPHAQGPRAVTAYVGKERAPKAVCRESTLSARAPLHGLRQSRTVVYDCDHMAIMGGMRPWPHISFKVREPGIVQRSSGSCFKNIRLIKNAILSMKATWNMVLLGSLVYKNTSFKDCNKK